MVSDTLSWIHGNHTIKFGAEFRRQNSDNFAYTPGTFTFPSITCLPCGSGQRLHGQYFESLQPHLWDRRRSLRTRFLENEADLSPLRWACVMTGTALPRKRRTGSWSSIPPATTPPARRPAGGLGQAYNQSALNFQPRVGLAWDPFQNGKTVVRSAYAIMTDQPTLGLVTGLAANPPYAFPVSLLTHHRCSFRDAGQCVYGRQRGGFSISVAHSYQDAYVSEWNFNIQQQFGHDFGVMLGYFGSKGTDLNIERNYNQPINGVRPYAALSSKQPHRSRIAAVQHSCV